jgi:hypothetical protein
MPIRIPYLHFALLLAAGAAAAQDVTVPEAKGLNLRPKHALAAASPERARAHDDFLRASPEPDLGLNPRAEDRRPDESRASCDKNGNTLCYDARSGKVVYKKTREYMPSLPGMRAEHISVRKDRITFKYSFQ